MIATYGSYTHDNYECGLTKVIVPVPDEQGTVIGRKHTINLMGKLVAGSKAALLAKRAALEAAYNMENQYFKFSEGSTVIHELNPALAFSGVKVVSGPNFNRDGVNDGGQYNTYIDYTIALEAEFRLPDRQNNNLLKFQESVRFWGGGPRGVYLPVLNGTPQAQYTHQQTTYKAEQYGTAVAELTYYPPSSPIWPFAQIEPDAQSVEYTGPEFENGVPTKYTTNWSYAFENVGPMSGRPRIVRP